MTTHTALLSELGGLIGERYVFPEVGDQIVAALAPAALDGADRDEVARRLTEQVQSVNGDRHLRVRPRPADEQAAEDPDAWFAAQAPLNAGGIRTVARLDQRIGLLEVAPYTSPVHVAEHYVAAAFAMLRGVEALVIDLRAGLGGTPETVALICGYLLGDEPVHLQDLVARDGTARQFWTSPSAGRLPESVRVCVLTSKRTFSGCEELAYNLQALGRATVIGERTGGGAHPIDVFVLPEDLEVAIPVARSVNAVTGTNWEQVGVVPDVACDAEGALESAIDFLSPLPKG